MIVLWLGLINWIVTTILVESEMFRPLRDWIDRRERFYDNPLDPGFSWRYTAWCKVKYLIGCHLCTGTWVGLTLALLVPGGPFVWILNGLLYKAVGHVVLEVVAALQRKGEWQ